MHDPAVLMVTEMHGLGGRERELRALLADLAAGALSEPGCVGFRVLGAGEAGELVLLSAWTGEDAMRAHYRTPHYRRYREAVGPLLARPSDVTIHHVRETVHPVDPNPPDPGMFG
jgi:quinol monooxygenase YgiN